MKIRAGITEKDSCLNMRRIALFFVMCLMLLTAGCGDLTRPSDFYFTTQTGVAQNATITSNTVTIVGNQFKAKVHIENGTYSIDSGTYTSDDGEIAVGQTLTIQQTSADAIKTATVTTVTVGGYTTTFTSVTSSSLSFSSQTDVALSSVIASNSLTIPSSWASGLAVSISSDASDQYAISTDSGSTWSSWSSSAGTIEPGQMIKVRHTSSSSYATSTTTTLTVGDNSITFVTTTASFTLSFTSVGSVELNTVTTSATVTLPSTFTSSSITISGGKYSIDGGTYTSSAGTIGPNQTLAVEVTSASTYNASATVTVTLGSSTSATFTATTKTAPTDSTGTITVLSFLPSSSLDSSNTIFSVVANIQNTNTTSASVTVTWSAKDSAGTVVANNSFTTTISASSTLSGTYNSRSELTTTLFDTITTWEVSVVKN
jgi:hypothetical protein